MENENIKLSAGEKLAITSRTPDKMPLNPTAQGWTGSAIRTELGKAILLLVDLLEGKLEGVYETFSAIGNVTVVDDLDDTTRETGVYIEGNDIVFHSGDSEEPVQIGIINGAFIYRTYVDDAWVDRVFEPSNSNIQEHIAIVDGNPHGVDKTDVGLGNVGNYGIASQEEAVVLAGEVNNKYMTPLRTKEAINAKASDYYDKTEIDSLVSTINHPTEVFKDLTALLADLDSETEYEVGTSFYLREMAQFDFWYTGVAEDDTEVAWAGYKISPLEAKTDLSDYVEKETGKELIPSADLLKLQTTDPFDNTGTYMGLKVGLAYNFEGAEPHLLNEAFDLRVTAGEDTEVTDGIARVKTLEAVVKQNGDGIITNITPKPTLLMASNDNMLEFLETYKNTSYGVTVEIVDAGVVRIYGTATDDIALENHGLSKYFGISNFYNASAKLYAKVIAGSIPEVVDIYYNSAIDSGITDGIVGTNAYITLDGSTKYLNQLEISLDIPDTTEIDVTLRFWTKHSSNPNQLWVRPNPLEYSLYTSELVEATDWFKENVINYDAKTFTKYWHKYTIDGSEATWSFYGSGSGAGTYVHILELTTDLTDLLLTSVAGAAYDGNLTFIGRASTYGTTNMVAGDIGVLFGTDGVNGIVFATDLELTNFKAVFSGSYPLPVWIKYLTPTITPLETITNEIVYPAFNYGLEFGLLGNKLGVEYSSDFQKQITTNLENIIELKATKAETIETSVTIDTTDWVADGVTATYKAVKTVSGVLSSDSPILAFDLTGIADTAWTASRTEFAKIGLASTTDDDEITFYASAIPSEDITVTVKVVR